MEETSYYGSLQFLDKRGKKFGSYPLGVFCCAIGSAVSAAIQLKPAANRILDGIHCLITVEEYEVVMIKNVNNVDPVQVNGSALAVNEDHVLCVGDFLDIGGNKMKYVCPRQQDKTKPRICMKKKIIESDDPAENVAVMKFQSSSTKSKRTNKHLTTPNSNLLLKNKSFSKTFPRNPCSESIEDEYEEKMDFDDDNCINGRLQFFNKQGKMMGSQPLGPEGCSIGLCSNANIQLMPTPNWRHAEFYCNIVVDYYGLATLECWDEQPSVRINKCIACKENLLLDGDLIEIADTIMKYDNPMLNERFGWEKNDSETQHSTPAKRMRTELEITPAHAQPPVIPCSSTPLKTMPIKNNSAPNFMKFLNREIIGKMDWCTLRTTTSEIEDLKELTKETLGNVHCFVTMDGENAKLESKNIVWPVEINGVKVYNEVQLKQGDLVDIGGNKLIYISPYQGVVPDLLTSPISPSSDSESKIVDVENSEEFKQLGLFKIRRHLFNEGSPISQENSIPSPQEEAIDLSRYFYDKGSPISQEEAINLTTNNSLITISSDLDERTPKKQLTPVNERKRKGQIFMVSPPGKLSQDNLLKCFEDSLELVPSLPFDEITSAEDFYEIL